MRIPKKTRWADGDTRPNPFVFVPVDEIADLLRITKTTTLGGVPFVPTGHPFVCVDTDELTRLRVVARSTQPEPPTEPPTNPFRWLVWLVVYKLAVVTYLLKTGRFNP